MTLECLALEKAYHRWSLSDFSLTAKEGEIIALVGPSGCGKTTVLRLIAGFEEHHGGEIRLGHQCLSGPRHHVLPEERGIGFVFQDHGLFPHMTVRENLLFAAKLPPSDIQNMLERVELPGLESRYPHQLSGGQCQRVALARCLIQKPKVVLLDEPLSSLDANLRDGLRERIVALLRAMGATALWVTHRPEDALAVADRIIALKNGEIQQKGTPETLYHHPKNEDVARFFGPLNVLNAQSKHNEILCPLGRIDVESVPPGPVKIGLRHHHIGLYPQGVKTILKAKRFAGRELLLDLELEDRSSVVMSYAGKEIFSRGDTLCIKAQEDKVLVFGAP